MTYRYSNTSNVTTQGLEVIENYPIEDAVSRNKAGMYRIKISIMHSDVNNEWRTVNTIIMWTKLKHYLHDFQLHNLPISLFPAFETS